MTEPAQNDISTTQKAEDPSTAAPASSQSPEAKGDSGTQAAPSVNWEEQVAAAKKEATDYYNRYLRSVADLENARKRALREKEEVRQYGIRQLLDDLLPVLDNLNLGLAAAKLPGADVKTLVGGVEMTLGQLKNVLGGHGLTEINPAGQPFDPHLHEAISHMPSPDVPAEHVMQVVRTGYTMPGRLLRPASVVVSSGPAKESR